MPLSTPVDTARTEPGPPGMRREIMENMGKNRMFCAWMRAHGRGEEESGCKQGWRAGPAALRQKDQSSEGRERGAGMAGRAGGGVAGSGMRKVRKRGRWSLAAARPGVLGMKDFPGRT